MGRFGPTIARFYAPNDLTTPLNSGGATRTAVEATSYDEVNALGDATLKFVNDAGLNTIAAAGNICWAVKTDSLRTDLSGNEVTFAEPFIIATRDVSTEPGFLIISGPSLLNELNGRVISRPLGHETTYNTTLAGTGGGPDTSRSLIAAAPAGVDSFMVDSASDADIGLELWVEMDSGAWFISEIIEIRQALGNKYFVTKDRLTGDTTSGNDIELRTRKIRVADPTGLAAGQEITVTLNSGSHLTLIEEGPSGDAGDEITLRDSLPSAANNGNAVVVKDYSLPSTNDVTMVMSYMGAPWSTEFETGTGTANGTRYPGGRESVYEILRSIAEETGEQFRLKSAEAATAGPKRRVMWRRTADSAGLSGTVRLVMPSQANMASDTANVNRAILIERPSHVGVYDAISHIVPVAGDARVTLFGCSAAALSAASSAGFTVVTTGLGLWAPPYVINDAMETDIGIVQRVVTFSEVTVEDDNTASIQAACDRLLGLALNYLKEHVSTAREIVARCISPIGIRAGQQVELYFESPTGEYTIDYTANKLFVQSVRRDEMPADDPNWPGAPVTTLTLTPTRQPIPRRASSIGRRLATIDRLVNKVASPQLTRLATGVGSGGGGVTPPPVAGVYLPLAGGTMTGNIAFSGTQTVDGVDVSAHAADASAHHAPVTAANASINLTGQAISVKLTSEAGLEVDGAFGLRIKRPTNSGIALLSTGAYLVPGTITAGGGNTLSGSTHYHAIDALDNTIGAGASILKSTGAGWLSLEKLGVGVAADASAALKIKARATNNYGLWLQQIASQTHDIWRVEDSSGNPLLRLTGPGHLESGTPAFVSGQTGWRIWNTGNAEFNDIRARGELHAAVFVADEMHAVGGTLLVKTAGKVGQPRSGQPNDNKLPAINSTFSLIAEASWDGGLNHFPAGSILRIKPMGEVASGGSLDLYDIYLQVTSAGSLTGRDLANGNPGYFVLTCNRRNGGDTGFVIPAGAAIVKWTATTGDPQGAVKITGDGDGATGPFMDMFTVDAKASGSWGGVLPVVKPRVRVGNLTGVLGGARGSWGIAGGDDLSNANATTAHYFAASDTGVWLHNVGIRIFNGSNQTVDITSSGAAKFGTNVTSDATVGLAFNPATGNVRLGPQAAGKPNLFWNDSAGSLALRQNTTDVIRLDSDGSSYFAGPMTIGSSGGIWQGTGGTFASPQGGLKIWNVDGAARLALFTAGGAQQITLRHDRGLEMSGSSSFPSSLTFAASPGGTIYGSLRSYTSGGDSISAYTVTDGSTQSGIAMSIGTAAIVRLLAGNSEFQMSSGASYARLSGVDFYVEDGGIAVGHNSTPSLARGVIASDLRGGTTPTVVLQDTVSVAHGMTDIASTGTYANFRKMDADAGGLRITGIGEDTRALDLYGYATNANSSTNTGALAPVMVSAYKKSGTDGTAPSGSENLFVVRAGSNARFIVMGNGDFAYDGSGSAFDDHDDVGMLRTLSRELWHGTIDSVWDRFVTANRQNLIDAGIMSDGGFINGVALNRLLTGAIWQLNERISELEAKLA